MKKQTHWITIPDEKLHTPASAESKKAAQKTADKPVTNKIFWGAGFVVLAVVSFALLAPSQFSALLKGSLFDTTGVPEENMQISLIPDKTKTADTTAKDTTTKDTATDVSGTDTTQSPAATPETDTASTAQTSGTDAQDSSSTDTATDTAMDAQTATPADDNVVKPEDQPVAISVKPIADTNTEAEDCGTDIACFTGHLKDCSLAKVTLDYKVSDKDFETDLEITGAETENCLFKSTFTKSPEVSLVGQSADCKLAKGDYKEEDVTKIFSDKSALSTACTGTGADTLGKYLDSMSPATPTATDAQAKLVADLQKQIDQLQQQRKDDIKTMQDLAQASQGQENLYPSAPASGNLPTGVVSTTAIGQAQTLQPGFRTNPYKVTVTPQQMLQQNIAGGAQYAQSSGTQYVQQSATYQGTTNYQQQYAQPYQQPASVISANGGTTPQTGPSEILLLTFALTFLGLVGWKFVRIVLS